MRRADQRTESCNTKTSSSSESRNMSIRDNWNQLPATWWIQRGRDWIRFMNVDMRTTQRSCRYPFKMKVGKTLLLTNCNESRMIHTINTTISVMRSKGLNQGISITIGSDGMTRCVRISNLCSFYIAFALSSKVLTSVRVVNDPLTDKSSKTKIACQTFAIPYK